MSATKAPYRIGIVGAGNISKLHLEGMQRHPGRVTAVALCDPDAQTLAARAGEYEIGKTFSSVAGMIAQGGVDAAIVCTPTHIRRPVVAPLLEAGIPVLCEKPLAETYAEAREIAEIARATGTRMAVNQNFRRHFAFALAREVLAAGRLGKPLQVAQVVQCLRHDKGWRLERKRYVMAVMSIHWFDGYRFMLDDEADSVYCRSVNSPATEGGEDTAVSVVMQFRKGAIVSLSESFSSYAQIHGCGVDCEAGGLKLEYQKMLEIRASGEKIEHANPYDKAEATYWVLDDLLRAEEENREPEVSVHDNVNSMRILEAAYRSAAENRVVKTEEIS